jgi:hypothetical protein
MAIWSLVDDGQGDEVVNGAGGGPGPAGEGGEVVVGEGFEEGFGVVGVAVDGVGGEVDAAEVAAADGGGDPGAGAGVIGEEDGEGAGSGRDQELEAEAGAVVGAEGEQDIADGDFAVAGFGDGLGAEVIGGAGEAADDPLLIEFADAPALLVPLVRRGDGGAGIDVGEGVRGGRVAGGTVSSRAAVRRCGAAILPRICR